MAKWFVNFREKGENSRVGGYVRADSEEERNELTDYFKAMDFKVVWD